jgi:hypothetical protein
MRQPQLKHTQIIRLQRLMDMLYRPAEIAEEIGVTPDTVYRSYIPAGLPHTRDAGGEVWIHGPSFADWARATICRQRSDRKPLPDGYAWCIRCKAPVPLVNPKRRAVNHVLDLLTSRCPHCSTTVNRGTAHNAVVRGPSSAVGAP